MEKFYLSAFADEYSEHFEAQLKMLSEQNIKYIEPRFLLSKNVSALTEKEAKEARKMLDEYGISVSSIGSPLGKIKLSDSFAEHLEAAKRCFETARILDTGNIRMFSFYLPEGAKRADCFSEVCERLYRMLELAEEYSITLCHENEADIYGESPENVYELVRAFEGRLRVVFDMGNYVLGGYRPYPDAYNLLREHIEYFHIKDALYCGAVVPPGMGEASISEILADFARGGRKTFVTLEPHLMDFAGLNDIAKKSFENPVNFSSAEEAFLFAADKIKSILSEV